MDLMRPNFSLHDSRYLSPLRSPTGSFIGKPIHPSHASFPILAVALIGILATAFLLVTYYIFVIKCCLNCHTSSRRRRIDDPLIYSQAAENRGLDEAMIRSIPVFKFRKSEVKDGVECTSVECSVCLNEFQENEKLRSIPNCAHIFHIDCIDVWLQNNANCPLCRNSITMSATTRYPMDQIMIPNTTSLRNSGDNFPSQDEEFVVIEIGEHNPSTDTNQDLLRVGERLNLGDLSAQVQVSPSPGKLQKPKMLHQNGKKGNLVSSMGDECIDIRQKDEQFSVQPLRRSISMDSAADRQLYLAVQQILLQNRQQSDVLLSEESSSNRVKRSFFSFGHGRGSNRAVLPVDEEL